MMRQCQTLICRNVAKNSEYITPYSLPALLPIIIDGMLQEGKAHVHVLRTEDKWFGVTYREDKDSVRDAFAELVKNGVYESPLNS